MMLGNHGLYRNGATFGSQFILDQLSVPSAAAFSLRKLRANYTGFAIRVRRSQDNAETDIGFDSQGNLDTGSLLSFVGANSGFISVWYDSSGNGRNATQTLSTRQARIVNNGAVEILNNKPTASFGYIAGQVSSYQITFNDSTLRDWTEVGVAKSNFTNLIANGNRLPTITDTVTSRIGMAVFSGTSVGPVWNANSSIIASGNLLMTAIARIFTGIASASATNVYLNGTLIASAVGVQTNRPTFSTLGSRFSQDANWLQGSVSEWIYFPSSLSDTNRLILERNEGIYYGITTI